MGFIVFLPRLIRPEMVCQAADVGGCTVITGAGACLVQLDVLRTSAAGR